VTIEEIKATIPQFTLEQRAELERCLHDWEDDEWDAQMKRDLADGKLDKLLKRVDTDKSVSFVGAGKHFGMKKPVSPEPIPQSEWKGLT
jgi:hypothetical protein